MKLLLTALLAAVSLAPLCRPAEAQSKLQPEGVSLGDTEWDPYLHRFVVYPKVSFGYATGGNAAGFQLWITILVTGETTEGANTTAPECLVWNFDNTEVNAATPRNVAVDLMPPPLDWTYSFGFKPGASIETDVMIIGPGGQTIDAASKQQTIYDEILPSAL